MAKPRMYGMNKTYIPNSRADERHRRNIENTRHMIGGKRKGGHGYAAKQSKA